MNEMFDLKNQYSGFGVASDAEMVELTKALTAGSGLDHTSFTGGRALIPEFLDDVLKITAYRMEDIVLWRSLPIRRVAAIMDEWNEKSAFGNRHGSWAAEAENPVEASSTYARRYGQVKFLRTYRSVSHPMTVVNTVLPDGPIAEEERDGTMFLLREAEYALFEGDSDIISEEVDGLYDLLTKGGHAGTLTKFTNPNVIDLRGKTFLDAGIEEKFDQGCRLIREKPDPGVPTHFYMGTDVQRDIDQLLKSNQRGAVTPPGINAQGEVVFGLPISRWATSFTRAGGVKLASDIFIDTQNRKAPAAASSAHASVPGKPTHALSATGGDANNQFLATDQGDYYYQVSALNKYGESEASTASAQAVTTGQKVVIEVTKGTGTPTGYIVYRSKKDAAAGTDCRYAFKVAYSASPQSVADNNFYLPGTSCGYMLNLDPTYDAIDIRQLMPLMKLWLAITAPNIPFLLMLYFYLRIPHPKQHVLYMNVGNSMDSDFDY